MANGWGWHISGISRTTRLLGDQAGQTGAGASRRRHPVIDDAGTSFSPFACFRTRAQRPELGRGASICIKEVGEATEGSYSGLLAAQYGTGQPPWNGFEASSG
ncbi:hypothetical protein KCP69_24845 [Salmonella enterica subsp. enterica]|nr:hypothetical protein KCP69_24845 [Salmonella enterica subsp. enterica]